MSRTLLSTTQPTSGTSVTITVPAGTSSTYRHLRLLITGRMVDPGTSYYWQQIKMSINGDTNGYYETLFLVGSSTRGAGFNTSQMHAGVNAGELSQSTDIGTSVVFFPNFANTTYYKKIMCGAGMVATASNTALLSDDINLWPSTAAITSITLGTFGVATWRTGTTIQLYGET